MRVNVWGINYYPELTGIGVYTKGLCEYLVQCGDQVSVTTAFPYYPQWRLAAEDRKAVYRTDQISAVEVHRCWHYVPAKPTPFKRILHEASFVFTSFLKQLTLPAPDLFIVVSPPLLLGAAAWIISSIKKAPFVFHVQDLQPDAAKGLSMVKNKTFLAALYGLENLAYARASLVSAISPDMCDAIEQKGVAQSKIVCFPNWIDLPESGRLPERGQWKKSRGISDNTAIVSYAGNFGAKQGLDSLIDAARFLEKKEGVLVVMAGDGAKKRHVEELKEKSGVKNVILEKVLTEDEHTSLLIDSDISVITQLPGTGKSFLPSKLLKILALRRPVITNADKESALHRAVLKGEFGLSVPDGNPQTLASAIMELLADKDRRRQMGEAGSRYVDQFKRSKVLPAYRKDIQNPMNSAGDHG